jgi:putative oxidoreductase
MEIVLLIGRILFALIFITSGIAHFTKLEAMSGYAQYKKVPAAKLMTLLTGFIILLGGIFIAAGIYADLGALLIALFLIPTAFKMRNFWTIEDATAKQGESINFFKNISLAGAALIIFALVANGADFGPSITADHFFNM